MGKGQVNFFFHFSVVKQNEKKKLSLSSECYHFSLFCRRRCHSICRHVESNVENDNDRLRLLLTFCIQFQFDLFVYNCIRLQNNCNNFNGKISASSAFVLSIFSSLFCFIDWQNQWNFVCEMENDQANNQKTFPLDQLNNLQFDLRLQVTVSRRSCE